MSYDALNCDANHIGNDHVFNIVGICDVHYDFDNGTTVVLKEPLWVVYLETPKRVNIILSRNGGI